MRKCLSLALVAASLLVGGCRSEPVNPDYQLTATVKDLMDSMVDPIADVIWNSVATVISATGTEERAPHTDEEWAVVRHGAITLMEATNLLRMTGRLVARPGEKSENTHIELEPAEIQALIDKDRATWNRLARGLHDATGEALKAIDARNAAALSEAGGKIDVACESCHLKYWYPNEKVPEFPADFGSSSAAMSPAAPGSAPGQGGSIRGHIRIDGKVPGNPVLRMGMDPKCAQINAGKTVVQQQVMARADGSLANVFVSLEGAFPQTPVPSTSVVIDQRECTYGPRVVGARVGQTLEVRNDDPLMHNVHGLSDRHNGFNVSEPSAGMAQRFVLKDEEIMLRLKCDIHSWMTSYVGVVNHPYFAVSDTSGTFEIANVPPGSRTVQIWHERYGTLTRVVQVTAGKTVPADFSYTDGALRP